MSEYFLDEPKFTEPNKNSLNLTLKNNMVMRRIRNIEQMSSRFTKELWASLSKHEIKAIEFAYINGKVTTKDLQEKIDRSPKIARKVLDSLENKGIFEWNGTSINDPKQYFEIKK